MVGESKICKFCSQIAVVFCAADQAFLCVSCDDQIHGKYVASHRLHRKPVQNKGGETSGGSRSQLRRTARGA